EQFRILLEGAVAEPEQRVSRLPILAEAERRRLLSEWNTGAAEFPVEQCLHQLFEAQVARTPGALAVTGDGLTLPYARLKERATRLGPRLQRPGAGPDVLVGLCLERSVEMVVAVLGILKAGGAYLPLDPSYPTERLAFMLQDARAPVVVTQRSLIERLPN